VIVMGSAGTVKYSAAGVRLWTNLSGGGAMAVDGNGDVILVSSSAIAKLSGSGALLWSASGGGTALALDGSNNIIVTGPVFGGTTMDYGTVKYTSAGELLWASRFDGPQHTNDKPIAVVTDHRNNVIVTGASGADYATVKYAMHVPVPIMTGLQLTNGSFDMRVTDLSADTLVIEVSSNLADWAPLFTNTAPTNVLFYTDPAASTNPIRFYRAFQIP
jgi:hypothetical protein